MLSYDISFVNSDINISFDFFLIRNLSKYTLEMVHIEKHVNIIICDLVRYAMFKNDIFFHLA
jgi:hypothetical protein